MDFKFGVSYSADTALVKRVLGEVAAGCELLLPDSEVFTGLSAYNDSSVEFTLRVWCATEDYWTVYFDINERMRAAFQKNGIEIPFPQLEARIIGK